jgi:predicted nuclease of predicted toxin-antitoxin system
MAVTFLLDENVEHEVLHRLNKLGHSAEHVELHPEFGKGASDTHIADYSRRNEIVIITYDRDFVTKYDTTEYYGVVYFEETTLSARDVSDILHTMAGHYPDSAFEGIEFAGAEWL